MGITVKRFIASEWTNIVQLTSLLNTLVNIKDDLKERIAEINGEERLDRLLEDASSFINDLLDTAPESQRRKLDRVCSDYKVVAVPKLSTYSTNILLTKEEAKTLTDFAQEKCILCLGEEEDVKRCKLYKVLESAMPLDSAKSIACPYSRAEWR